MSELVDVPQTKQDWSKPLEGTFGLGSVNFEVPTVNRLSAICSRLLTMSG